MMHSPFARLVWKEYRQMRGFWVGLVLLAVMLQVIFGTLTRWDAAPNYCAFALAYFFPILFAIGAGATAFALEHEEGTYEYLRRLPMQPRLALAANVTCIGLGMAGMLGLLWTCAALWFHWQKQEMPPLSHQRMLLGVFGLASLESLTWGLLCSLVIAQPLRAAIAAVAASAFSVQLTTALANPDIYVHLDESQGYLTAIPHRLTLLALVALAVWWLAPRWMDGQVPRPWRSLRRKSGTNQRASGAIRPLFSTKLTQLAHLTWQARREAMPKVWLLAVLAAVILLFQLNWAIRDNLRLGDCFAIDAFYTVLVVALCGIFTFRADQYRRVYRFFGERGISARRVWLSRHLVWLAIFIVWTLALFSASFVIWAMLGSSTHYNQPEGVAIPWRDLSMGLTFAVGCPMVGYAAGQVMSLLVRSSVLAFTFGLTLAGLLLAWAALMADLQISWLWSVYPIAALLMLATWLRAPYWLLERRDWRSWRSCVAALLSILLLLPAVALYRAYQIPEVTPTFPWDAPEVLPSAAGEKTLEMYKQSFDLAQEAFRKRDGQKQNRDQALLIAMEASTRAEIPRQPKEADGAYYFGTLESLLLANGRELQTQGKLDESLDSYLAVLRIIRHSKLAYPDVSPTMTISVLRGLVDWAADKNQTSALIRKAIRELEQWHEELPLLTDASKADYLLNVDQIHKIAGAKLYKIRADRQLSTLAIIESRMPWEVARALRLIDHIAAFDVNYLQQVEFDLASNDIRNANQLRSAYNYFYHSRERYPQSLTDWIETTPLVNRNNNTHRIVKNAIFEETRYRVAILLLALEAWKTDHDRQLPERLDQLVSAYLDELPIDPLIGFPFAYFPHGVSFKLAYDDFNAYEKIALASDQPFIWSVLPTNASDYVKVSAQKDPEKEGSVVYHRETEAIQSQDQIPQDVLLLGTPFVIP